MKKDRICQDFKIILIIIMPNFKINNNNINHQNKRKNKALFRILIIKAVKFQMIILINRSLYMKGNK